MNNKLIYAVVFCIMSSYFGCGKSDIDIQKEQIQKRAAELKDQIDSTRMKLDSAMVEYDSLKRRISEQGNEIDSLVKKINPLK